MKQLECRKWRPLALGLAAAAICATLAGAQSVPLADRIQTCGACHGEDGNSKMENIPSLAGQPEFLIVNQLVLMRENVRQVEAMKPFVADLNDEDIKALAGHFAKLAPKPSDEPVDPALARKGADLAVGRKCESCHGRNLEGQEQIPRLARQRIDYLVKALKEFRDTSRPGGDTLMSGALVRLTDADLAALAHYAASK